MLIELIDKYYEDRREERNQEHFYISDAGKCQRVVYFSMKGYPRKEKEARVLRIFAWRIHNRPGFLILR